MRFYNRKSNVITSSLNIVVPQCIMDFKKKIVVTDHLKNKSYYIEIGSVYTYSLLKYHYGIGLYLTNLLTFTVGMHKRTLYYFLPVFFESHFITTLYVKLNKSLYDIYTGYLKKKFNSRSYWASRFLRKFPCRGQRRRTNASTSRKLNIISRFNINVVNVKKKVKVKVTQKKKNSKRK